MSIKLQDKKIATGLSLPKALKDQIDKERGDIPRSKYILRILEKHKRKLIRNHIKKAQSESRRQPNTQPSAASPSTTGGPES